MDTKQISANKEFLMEWIDVKERLPPNDVYVLISRFKEHKKDPIGDMYLVAIACRFNSVWVDDHDGDVLSSKDGIVTHWMPLPDAPNKG